MTSAFIEDRPLTSYVAPGLLFSLLVHAVFVTLLFLRSPFPPGALPTSDLPVMVSFVPPERSSPPVPQKQIVSPSEMNQNTAPLSDAFQSDTDSRVDHEQLKRGAGPDAGATLGDKAGAPARQAAPKTSPPKPAESAEAENKAAPKRPLEQADLSLDNATLLKRFGESSRESTDDRIKAALAGQVSAAPNASLSQVEPFSRMSGSGARFIGSSGSTDYIPTLPDGDITMLNTKANQYATFVRRVALQVFSNLRSSGWERLRASDVQAMGKDSTVRAVLSKQGALLKVSIDEESGSQRFDEVLHTAVASGVKDPNPPAAAALDDGNIHFIFKARSWVRVLANPRSGFPEERRWLVLGTGLE